MTDALSLPLMDAFELGETSPADWRPEYHIFARLKLGEDQGTPEWQLEARNVRLPQSTGSFSKPDPELLGAAFADKAAGQSAADISIVGDAYVVIELDPRHFKSWLTRLGAIRTKDDHQKEYFDLAYWDNAGGGYVDRATAEKQGLQSLVICFGARWMREHLGNTQYHKFTYSFIFSGGETHFDPEIGNPKDP